MPNSDLGEHFDAPANMKDEVLSHPQAPAVSHSHAMGDVVMKSELNSSKQSNNRKLFMASDPMTYSHIWDPKPSEGPKGGDSKDSEDSSTNKPSSGGGRHRTPSGRYPTAQPGDTSPTGGSTTGGSSTGGSTTGGSTSTTGGSTPPWQGPLRPGQTPPVSNKPTDDKPGVGTGRRPKRLTPRDMINGIGYIEGDNNFNFGDLSSGNNRDEAFISGNYMRYMERRIPGLKTRTQNHLGKAMKMFINYIVFKENKNTNVIHPSRLRGKFFFEINLKDGNFLMVEKDYAGRLRNGSDYKLLLKSLRSKASSERDRITESIGKKKRP